MKSLRGSKYYWVMFVLMLIILPTVLVGLLLVFAPSLVPRGLRRLIPVKRKWKKLASPQLQQAVNSLSKAKGINRNDIYLALYLESRFDPGAENQTTHASGLWQALPATADWLNISKLSSYDISRQISELGRYLDKTNKDADLASASDVYLSIFYPAAVGKPDSYTFPANVAKYNPGFDLDKNGSITKSEVTRFLKTFESRI